MKRKSIDLFVPGRICLFGEHSDWAGEYKAFNKKVASGEAIVTGINEGIYAKATKHHSLIMKSELDNSLFECEMNIEKLTKFAKEGGYYSYACGVALYMFENYDVDGIEINICKQTLPIKKGLSSSAAICVLIARAFNMLYNLKLDTLHEMEAAYYGELNTPSKCGRLDQACAFGINPISMEFENGSITIENLKIRGNFYWVFADLNGHKNTIRILTDLHKCFPYPKTDVEKNVHIALGVINKEIIKKAKKFLENDDAKKLGELMNFSQKIFDDMILPASPEELKSPIFHQVFEDVHIKKLIYGAKGVGSHGDGCIQFLAKDLSSQTQLINYLESNLNMNAYKFSITNVKRLHKAVIPLAGHGTRLLPITKAFPKAFLPITSEDGLVKPSIMFLLEELDNAGIDEIGLIIDKADIKIYKNFFKDILNEDYLKKLPKNIIEYLELINRISKKIKYIYQKEKLGLAHAIYGCKSFVGDEPFLMLLGDQIYESFCKESCVNQVLQSFQTTSKMTISLFRTPLEMVPNYGIATGDFIFDNSHIDITKIVEKPNIEYARQFLNTVDLNGECQYYSIFGIYVLFSNIFEEIENMIENNRVSNRGEYEITTAIESLRKKNGVIGFVPDGRYYDLGNSKAYNETSLIFQEKRSDI